MVRFDASIVAVATASGRGAVGIVRVSGANLGPLVRAICGRELTPRQASYLPFLDAAGGPIDQGLALFFPAPNSYTGEDVLELQAHGGPVVLQLLLARCLEAGCGTLRIARPGEFTERAFLNDKLDLAQAEAVADLIEASTEAAARSAARSLDGAFSAEITTLGDELVSLRTLVEATLDFPDEEVEFLETADARGRLARTTASVCTVLARARQGALLRDGVRVVLAGQPNVGKSSLLNALAGAELAIVTATPGTTRDKVGQTIQIEGVPLHVVDTAGLRNAAEEVERIGVERSWAEIDGADAVVFLHDLTRLGEAAYEKTEREIEARLPGRLVREGWLLHIFNKVDIAPTVDAVEGLTISAATGHGLDTLRRRLLELAGWQAVPEGLFIARARHVDALHRARDHLELALAHARDGNAALELFAEELRLAHDALSEITGRFTPDDLLGVIFGRFCIGK